MKRKAPASNVKTNKFSYDGLGPQFIVIHRRRFARIWTCSSLAFYQFLACLNNFQHSVTHHEFRYV